MKYFIIILMICNYVLCFSLADWMRDLNAVIGNRPINRVIMPGSHDSGSYNLGNEIPPKEDIPYGLNVLSKWGINIVNDIVIRPWAKTQSLSIYDQLMNGTRAFDLRVAFRDADRDFYVVHGLLGPKLSEVLNDMVKFLQEHPQEIIIISVALKYMGNDIVGNNNAVITKLKNAFGDKLMIRGQLSPKSTVNDITKAGKRVLVIYKDNAFAMKDNSLWPQETDISNWTNSQYIDQLQSRVDNIWSSRDPNTLNKDDFYGLYLTLTPDKDSIVASVNPINLAFIHKSVCTNLMEIAGAVKLFIPNWLVNYKDKNISIVYYDDVDGVINNAIVNMNNYLGKALTPPAIGGGDICNRYSCPAGYTDTGAHCLKPDAYGRGVGYVIWDKGKCEAENGRCEQCLAMHYPVCRQGYSPVGCNICSPTCPSYTTDIGISCEKAKR